jgi:hypothetical protein
MMTNDNLDDTPSTRREKVLSETCESAGALPLQGLDRRHEKEWHEPARMIERAEEMVTSDEKVECSLARAFALRPPSYLPIPTAGKNAPQLFLI